MPTCSMQFLTSRWPMARVQLVALQAIAIRYKVGLVPSPSSQRFFSTSWETPFTFAPHDERNFFSRGWVAGRFRFAGPIPRASDTEPLRERLKALPFKIAYESYVNGNWEIFVMNPDGSGALNLTKTPDLNEHYPQVSPDGTKMCFVADKGEGREAVRSLYVMDIDGRNRKKIADYAREPFWAPDGKVLGYSTRSIPSLTSLITTPRG